MTADALRRWADTHAKADLPLAAAVQRLFAKIDNLERLLSTLLERCGALVEIVAANALRERGKPTAGSEAAELVKVILRHFDEQNGLS